MSWIHTVLQTLALPQVGLGAVFIVAFISATLVPLGSEPAVYALVLWRPELFWPAVLVATVGNTLGGVLSWWMGAGAHALTHRWKLVPTGSSLPVRAPDRWEQRAMAWLERFGPKACLLSWLPLVGDPLCAVAGWLRLPLGPCVAYMAVGKFLRYLSATAFLVWVS